MENNDIMRRIRYIFDYSDAKMNEIYEHTGYTASREDMSGWLKRLDDPGFKECEDLNLAIFLNGLIQEKRGKKDGPQPVPEKELTNNIIFMKLKIALNLKAEDVLEILNLGNMKVSKHELSAFFRKRDNKHYRECKDQILRNFLNGAQKKYRPAS